MSWSSQFKSDSDSFKTTPDNRLSNPFLNECMNGPSHQSSISPDCKKKISPSDFVQDSGRVSWFDRNISRIVFTYDLHVIDVSVYGKRLGK